MKEKKSPKEKMIGRRIEGARMMKEIVIDDDDDEIKH